MPEVEKLIDFTDVSQKEKKTFSDMVEERKIALIKVIFPDHTNIRNNQVKFMIGDLRLPVSDFTISPEGERNTVKLTLKIDPNYFQIVEEK